jgi:hypothetical protein
VGWRHIVSCGALPSTASWLLDIAAVDRRSFGQPAINRYSRPVFGDHEQRSVSGMGMADTASLSSSRRLLFSLLVFAIVARFSFYRSKRASYKK